MLKDFASYSEDNLSHIMERYNIIMGGNNSHQCQGYGSALFFLRIQFTKTYRSMDSDQSGKKSAKMFCS